MERDLIVGGQAVMEGVMMRTPSAYAIACRKKRGEIVTTAESLPKWSDKHKWLNLPVIRGGATLIQSMALGVKALNFSASIAHEDMEAEEAEKSRAHDPPRDGPDGPRAQPARPRVDRSPRCSVPSHHEAPPARARSVRPPAGRAPRAGSAP